MQETKALGWNGFHLICCFFFHFLWVVFQCKNMADGKTHSARVQKYVNGCAECQMLCGLKNMSNSEKADVLVFSSPPQWYSSSALPLCLPEYHLFPVAVFWFNMHPDLNYFGSLWVFLTSNKGINQTSTRVDVSLEDGWVCSFAASPLGGARVQAKTIPVIHSRSCST